MIDDVSFNYKGKSRNVRSMLMTRLQARMFDSSNIGKLLHAFEIETPKLVVKLGASHNGVDHTCSMPDSWKEEGFDFSQRVFDREEVKGKAPFLTHPTLEEAEQAEQGLDKFCAEVLFCKKTNCQSNAIH